MTIGMANLAVLAKKWDRLLRVELSKRQSYKAGPGVEGTSNNKKLLGAPGIATNGAFLLVTIANQIVGTWNSYQKRHCWMVDKFGGIPHPKVKGVSWAYWHP